MTKTLNKADLSQFTGSATWYRHGLARNILFTDGVKYVADQAEAYWLLDEIAFAQRGHRGVAAEPFQCWRLCVQADQTAILTCEDGDRRIILRKAIDYTDFPMPEIEIFFANNTIYLPSED